MKRQPLLITAVAVALAGSASLWLHAAQTPTREADINQIPIDADDIAGVVRSARGPEAGVWVIAETTDTPTKFRKIVVTDDQGRYLLPDLPGRRATYRIWVRGYGLVDSVPVRSTPGRRLALAAVPAPGLRAAAQYYPANYWYSIINIPPEKEFPGTGPAGNGISPDIGDATSLDQPDQSKLQRLSPVGQQGNPGDSGGAREIRVDRGGVGSPRASRTGWPGHELGGHRARACAGSRDVCELDRPDRSR